MFKPIRIRLILAFILLLPFHLGHAGSTPLQLFFTQVKSLSADFEQTLTDARGKVLQQSSGKFLLQRPGRFRWDYQAPYKQLIVANGQKIWIYDPDLEQVTVKPQATALGSAPAELLSSGESLAANFTVSELGKEDGLDWYELKPKDAETGFDSVRLSFRGRDLEMMKLSDALGQFTLLRFSNIQHNPKISAEQFTFTPPPGVDIVEDAPKK